MYAENAAVQLSLENFEKVIKQVAEDKKTEVLKAKQQEEEKKKFSQGNQKLVYDDTKINPEASASISNTKIFNKNNPC